METSLKNNQDLGDYYGNDLFEKILSEILFAGGLTSSFEFQTESQNNEGVR